MPNTHITFAVDGPARFELIVGKDGTVLYGYEGKEPAPEQEPGLAYDTDGSFWAEGGFSMRRAGAEED